MKKKIYYYLLLITSLSACISEKKINDNTQQIDVQELKKVQFIACNDTTYISQCKLVKLEFSENSIIGEISQIEIYNGYIYILDKKTESLKVFNIEGKYIQNIGKKGQGPGEYLALNTFYINKKDGIINIFDPLKLSVNKYTLNGEFKESVKINKPYIAHIARAVQLDNKTIFCFTNPNWHLEAGYFVLNENDYSMRKQIYQFPVQIKKEMSYNLLSHPFSYYDKKINYVSLFSNIIYSYKDKESIPLYYIDNDKEECSKEYLEKIAGNDVNYMIILQKLIASDTYTPGLKNIYETDRYICIDFFSKNFLSEAILWDKKNNSGCYIKDYYDYLPNFGSIVNDFDNTLVRIWSTNSILAFKKNLEDQNISINSYPQSIINEINQYSEEDNPILLLYTMKE